MATEKESPANHRLEGGSGRGAKVESSAGGNLEVAAQFLVSYVYLLLRKITI